MEIENRWLKDLFFLILMKSGNPSFLSSAPQISQNLSLIIIIQVSILNLKRIMFTLQLSYLNRSPIVS